jgi:hypothetical protein
MRVRFGVGDDQVGGTEGTEVDPLQRAGREGAGTEAAAVTDERVRERDEWVEHHRPSARRTPRRRQVEMSRVPDDEHVEAPGTACEQPCFCRREAQRAPRAGGPALTQVVPHRDVLLCDFHPCRAQARDHLCVARIRTLVGAEVTDFHRCVGGRFRPPRSNKLV